MLKVFIQYYYTEGQQQSKIEFQAQLYTNNEHVTANMFIFFFEIAMVDSSITLVRVMCKDDSATEK